MTSGDQALPIRSLLRTLERVGSRLLEERSTGAERLVLRGGPVKPLPDHIRQAIIAALDEPDRRPSRGLPELRQAITHALREETGAGLDPEREILVTHGAMQALNLVCRALLNPGERVLIPTPNFFLEGVVRLAGGEPEYVPGEERDGWRWDLDRLEAALATGNIKIVFACNPTNPTGYLPRRDELAALLEMAEKHGLIVLADESYNRFVYDGAPFTSILALRHLSDRWLLVRSLSKSHALASWRVGYLTGARALVDACLTVLEWEMLHCAYLNQRVAAATLTGPLDWLGDLAGEYQRNRDRVFAAVKASLWIEARKPQAGPFLFPRVDRLERTGIPAEDQLLALGIPTVAGKYFRAPGHVRLPFGGDDATIDRLCQLLYALTPARRVAASRQ